MPTPGTMRRRVLDAMLSSRGLRHGDIPGLESSALSNVVRFLVDEGGWDIRTFPDPRERERSGSGARHLIYRIVGRWSWDGQYTDLVVNSLPGGWDS